MNGFDSVEGSSRNGIDNVLRLGELGMRRKDGRGRKSTVRSLKISGPLPRSKRKCGDQESEEKCPDIDWETQCEEDLRIEENLDPDQED